MGSPAFDLPPDPNSRPKSETEVALLTRILRYFETAVGNLPKKDQAKALAAPDDFWALMETLALVPVKESPELRVRLRGAIAKREILEAQGGVINPSSVAALLSISRQAVGQKRAAGKLLGLKIPTGYVYPVWQFDGPKTLQGFEQVLQQLSNCDPWAQFFFFLSKNDAANGKRPLDLLLRGKLPTALRAAELHGKQVAV